MPGDLEQHSAQGVTGYSDDEIAVVRNHLPKIGVDLKRFWKG